MKKLNVFTALISAVLFMSSVSLVACKHAPEGTSDPAGVTETGITVAYGENDGVFTVGDEISASDFVVKVTTSDGKSKGVTSGVTVAVPAANLDAEGALKRSEGSEGTSETVTVTIKYKNFTADKNITVEDYVEPAATEYDVNFSASGNTSTYADGVYTITVNAVQDASGNWGNQIFISNPNAETDIKAGDLIIAKLTAEADKDIASLFVKDQFNSGSYSGIDSSKAIPANTPVDFEIVGVVADDYDDSAKFVLDVRGNVAGTILKISNISVSKYTYEVESVELVADTTSPAAGETVTFTAKDQYGIAIKDDVTYEITSEDSASTIEGNVLTAGSVAETVTVKAVYGEIESDTVTITVSENKDYNKYFKPEITTEASDAPKNYFSIWYDHNWCGSLVTPSDMNATATGFTLTRTTENAENCWFGTQIWYGLDAESDVSFDITSPVSGLITVSGKVFELEAGVKKTVEVRAATYVGIQLGYEASDVNKNAGYPDVNSTLADGTVTVTNFTVTPVVQ